METCQRENERREIEEKSRRKKVYFIFNTNIAGIFFFIFSLLCEWVTLGSFSKAENKIRSLFESDSISVIIRSRTEENRSIVVGLFLIDCAKNRALISFIKYFVRWKWVFARDCTQLKKQTAKVFSIVKSSAREMILWKSHILILINVTWPSTV